MPNIIKGGNPNVVLIAGDGKVYTDIAARFVASDRPIEDIVNSSYNPKIVENILKRGHLAATEFDYFIFGVEGVSRVTETQLVRKRMASYLISSGRVEKNGKRPFNVIRPPSISEDFAVKVKVPLPVDTKGERHQHTLSYADLMYINEQWYNSAVMLGIPEQDARFSKPQATEAKLLIGMNAHALIDWFKVRCCMKAQWEIRILANEMLRLCKQVKPDLFVNAGSNCKLLGYCPENDGQCKIYKGSIPTHQDVLHLIKKHYTPYTFKYAGK